MSSTEPTTTAWVSMTFPTRNYESPVKARIQIQDRVSGHLIAEIDLTADQVCDLISARNIKVPATLAPVEQRAQYGMELITHTEPIPREAYVDTPFGSPARKIATSNWAQEWMDDFNGTHDGPEWETFFTSNHNDGWRATFRRWDARRSTEEPNP